MFTTTKTRTAAIASALMLSLGGATYATAATTGKSTTSTKSSTTGKKRGPRMDTAALAKALGVSEAKLKAALEATRPAKGTKPAGGPGAELAKVIAASLGVSQTDVQEVLDDANRPARPAAGTRPAAPPARPDQSKLIAALAEKFGVSTEKAKAAVDAADAAHRAQHEARDDAMATALAKELGLDVEKVKAALEASRPAKKG